MEATPLSERPPPGGDARSLAAFRLFCFFCFGAGAALMSNLLLHYRGAGLPGSLVGVLAAVQPPVMLFAATLWSGLADATRSHRRVLSLTVAGTTACSAAVGLAARFELLRSR